MFLELIEAFVPYILGRLLIYFLFVEQDLSFQSDDQVKQHYYLYYNHCRIYFFCYLLSTYFHIDSKSLYFKRYFYLEKPITNPRNNKKTWFSKQYVLRFIWHNLCFVLFILALNCVFGLEFTWSNFTKAVFLSIYTWILSFFDFYTNNFPLIDNGLAVTEILKVERNQREVLQRLNSTRIFAPDPFVLRRLGYDKDFRQLIPELSENLQEKIKENLPSQLEITLEDELVTEYFYNIINFIDGPWNNILYHELWQQRIILLSGLFSLFFVALDWKVAWQNFPIVQFYGITYGYMISRVYLVLVEIYVTYIKKSI